MRFQLPDLDLYNYYEEEVSDENSNTDVTIRDGEFCWGKVLSDEEMKQLHASGRRPVKDKGKGKKSKTVVFADSPDSCEAGNSREFSLTEINLNIKKVGLIYNSQKKYSMKEERCTCKDAVVKIKTILLCC